MSKWAQRQRRVNIPTEGLVALPSAPVLSLECSEGHVRISWAWAGDEPDHWDILFGESPEGLGPLVTVDGELLEYLDEERVCPGGFEVWYQVRGYDEFGDPFTEASNIEQWLVEEY